MIESEYWGMRRVSGKLMVQQDRYRRCIYHMLVNECEKISYFSEITVIIFEISVFPNDNTEFLEVFLKLKIP